MGVLHIIYDEIPPTSNHIYFRGTQLTTKAREYAERFSHFIVRNHLHEIGTLNKKGVFELSLIFYFETVINTSYNNPKIPPSKQAKERYKRFDLTNRIKLIEDCVRDAIQIDDSRTFESHQLKMMDPFRPRVEIFVNEVNPDWYGVPREMLLI